MSGEQMTLTGESVSCDMVTKRDHLTRFRSEVGTTSPLTINDGKKREAWCHECGRRITVGKSGKEYGHARERNHCKHAIELTEWSE